MTNPSVTCIETVEEDQKVLQEWFESLPEQEMHRFALLFEQMRLEQRAIEEARTQGVEEIASGLAEFEMTT